MRHQFHEFTLSGSASDSSVTRFVMIRVIGVFECAALLFSLLIPVAHIYAQTQADMNSQTRAECVQADSELNKTYEALLAKLPDAESKQKLKESQRAWLAFRDAEAAFAADQARGGSDGAYAPLRNDYGTHSTADQTAKHKAYRLRPHHALSAPGRMNNEKKNE